MVVYLATRKLDSNINLTVGSPILVQPYHMVFVKTDQVNTFFFSPPINTHYLLYLSFGATLRIELRAQCMLGKHSSTAYVPVPFSLFILEHFR